MVVCCVLCFCFVVDYYIIMMPLYNYSKQHKDFVVTSDVLKRIYVVLYWC